MRFSNGRQFDIVAKSTHQINPHYWNNKARIVRDVAEFTDRGELQNKLDLLKEYIMKKFREIPDKSTIDKIWLEKTIESSYNKDKNEANNTHDQ